MERVEDAIDGRRIAVVVNAAQLPLPKAGGWWARSRQLRRFARTNGASHLLRVRDSSDDTDTWWAGRGGVSFAAAIDAWTGTVDNRSDVVVVSLDRRVYAAELEDGLVEREYMLGAARLPAMMTGWEQRSITVFAAGRMSSAFDESLRPEALPFDLTASRFRPASVALTAAGLFAPPQTLALALVAVAAAAPNIRVGMIDHQDGSAAPAAVEASEHASALEGSFAASTILMGLADIAWDRAALLLHRDGLAEMRYSRAFEVTFSGHSGAGYPHGAAAYATAYSAELSVAGERWEVRRPIPWGDAGRRSVEGFDAERLAEDLHAASGSARAEVSPSPGVASGGVEEREYALRISAATRGDLRQLGAALAGRPFRLERLRCTFVGYLASVCDMRLVAKGLAE